MPSDPNGGPFAKAIVAVWGFGARALIWVKNIFTKEVPDPPKPPERKGS
jgi:hypothetical protein